MTVAFEAEGHAERLGVADLVHLVDAAVAFEATDAAVDVDGMVEVNEARQLVNLDPGHRLAALGALANQLQARIVLEHLIVTVHAGGTGGDIGEPGLLDAGVAVAAIHSQLAGMRRVRKRHRLDRLITHPRVFGCKIIPDTRRHGAAHQQKAGDNHHRQPVGPLWEDGRHPGPSLTSRYSVAHSSKAQTAHTKQKTDSCRE